MKKTKILLFLQFTFIIVYAQNWTLKWQDNFEITTTPNTSVWTLEEDGWGGGNSELQCYTPNNVTIETYQGLKCLVLSAKKENYTWALKNKVCPATSGRVNSQGKVYFKYGKVESRMKLPSTANGLWPAFWFMGNDRTFNINNFNNSWPYCGEIDVMECGNAGGIVSNNQATNFGGALHWGTVSPYIHYMDYTSINAAYSIQDEEFHLYTLIWNADSIKMYLDQDKYPSAKPFYAQRILNGSNIPNGGGGNFNAIYDQFHKPFYILYNLAVGGSYTGIYDINAITAIASNGSPAKMYIDYVRIYQKGDAGEEFFSATTYSDTEIPALTSATLSSITKTSVEIEVQGSDNSGSVIYKASANGKLWSTEVASVTQKSLIVTGLAAGTSYNFTVTANDASGNVSSSSIPIFTTTLSNAECEGLSTASQSATEFLTFDTGYNFTFTTSGTNVTVTYEMLDGKNVYAAYLWKNNSGFAEYPMTKSIGKKYKYTLTNQTTGAKLSTACKFVVDNGACVTQYQNYIVGNNCAASGIENVTSNKVSLYPNPVKCTLNIASDNAINQVIIRNLLGQTVKTNEVNSQRQSINLSDILSGSYLIITVLENGEKMVSTIIKE